VAVGGRLNEHYCVETASVTQAEPEISPNAENLYQVTRRDLPLSCPMPGMSLWNSHPKVYLPVEATGTSKCPYCGAEFVLVEEAS